MSNYRRSLRKVRIQLDLSVKEGAALDDIRDDCGLGSRADAVKAALALFGWVQAETRLGRKVVAMDGETVSWLVLPGITDRSDRDELPEGAGANP
jgi:hypothetical protein